jgi:hypothetical protein
MPYNGSGIYTPPGADFPAVTQTVISSTKYNNVINDIATALSTALTKDGQTVVTGNINFGGFRATNIGITGINGTVGAPAINVGDAATGLYRSAASELAVSINGTQRGRFDSTGLIVTGAISGTTGTFTTSVVTPKIESAAAASITMAPEGTNRWTFSRLGTFPIAPIGDATQDVGTTTGRILNVFATAIDSGTTGSLSLKTNNGTTGFQVEHVAGTVVNNLAVISSITGVSLSLVARGTDSNIPVDFITKGSGAHNFYADAGSATLQFQILRTASATRNITVTGSNGDVPLFNASAGDRVGVGVGSGTGIANLGGLLHINNTSVGNVGAGEDDLMSYSLPANSFSQNQKGVRVTAWGRTANNANAKSIRLYYGAAGQESVMTISIAGAWFYEMLVFRTSDGNVVINWEIREVVNAAGVITTATSKGGARLNFALAQSTSAATTIKCTGQATSNDDIIQDGMLIEYLS